MLTLLTFDGTPEIPSLSPFCLKAMCLLELSGRAWQPKYLQDPGKMPYGRLPVLEVDGRKIADSGQIQAFLESTGTDFDPGLSDEQRAASHALIRMVEENLRCGLVYERWLRDDNWAVMSQVIFGGVPGPMRPLIAGMVRRKVSKGMKSHGIAQFNESDRTDSLQRDVNAVATTLGDKPFLFGDTVGSADAAIAPVLHMIETIPTDGVVRRMVKDHATLPAYIQRVSAVAYPKASKAA